jgi:hypothetical protein
MRVTMSGNLVRSHQPSIRAACLYHKYLQRSWIPKSPRRFHRLGRGCARSVVASKRRTTRDAPSLETPCPVNQLSSSPSKATRSALFQLPPLSMYTPHTLWNQFGVSETNQLHTLKRGIGQSPATKTSCSKTSNPFPPQTKMKYPRRGCHNRKSRLHTSKSPSSCSPSDPPQKIKQIPKALNMEWRRWKAKQTRGNALGLPSPHERVLPNDLTGRGGHQRPPHNTQRHRPDCPAVPGLLPCSQ